MLRIGAQRPEDLWRKQRRPSILRSMSTSLNSYEDIGEKAEDVEARKPNNNIEKTKDAEHREAREPIEKAEEAKPTKDTHEMSLPVTMIIW